MTLYQFNGKTASFLFLNGRVIKNWMPLKMSYTIEDPNNLHEFNSKFNYEMEAYRSDNGTYTVNIYSDDDFTSFRCNENTISIEYLELTSKVEDTSFMFRNCSSLTSLDLSNFDTSKVTNMKYMFYYCYNLASIDVSSFNTSEVTNMNGMFYNCQPLTTLDLSSFNTSKVTDMSDMFYYCKNLTTLNLSSFNTIKVTDMNDILGDCSKLISINMDSSDVDSINDIIAQLPTKTSSSYGTMTVSGDVLNSVDTASASSKYWNVVKPPEYTFTLDTLKYLLTTIKSKFITKEEMNNKVDKVEGKQLSSNNFSDEDVNNISNSFDDAEVNQNGTTISFYSTSVDGTKTKIKDIDLDI